MKAFAITDRATPPAVQDLPQPDPAAGEVLVQMEAASVNGFDLSVAAGHVWDMLPHQFPIVLGRDLVGTVTALGDGVEDLTVGDRVAGVIPGVDLGVRTGSLAEHVALPADAVTRLPAGVEFQDAAVIGLAGVAATDALATLDLRPGQSVLISGATGGVGSIAIQLAVAAGAAVIATARPGDEAQYVRSLGATHTIDYTADLVSELGTIAYDGIGKALHAAGDPGALSGLLRTGGTVASTLGAGVEQFGRDDLTVTPIMAAATANKLAALLDQVAAKTLRVNVHTAVPLDRAPEAFDAFAGGTLGKVLITR